MRQLYLSIYLSCFVMHSAVAEPPFWHSNNVFLLYGDHYEVDSPEQSTVTFEHASGWSFGDLFFFVDLTHFNNSSQPDSLYGEFSPRFSISKLGQSDISFGPVSDILIATSYEFGKGDVEGILIGPGLDLKLPGFDFFQINFYKRFITSDRDGETWQLTPAWSKTWPAFNSDLVFEGYLDWNFTSDGSYTENLHFNPRLKYDIGKLFQADKKKAYVGFEYSYWNNKYGIQDSAVFDTDQNTVSLFVNLGF